MRIIKVVTELSAKKLMSLGTYATREVALDPANLRTIEQLSSAIWELEVNGMFVGYAGIARESLLSEPVFWCLFGAVHRPATVKAYRHFSRLLHQHYPDCITYVEQGWIVGERFAEFCGFTPTTQTYVAHDKDYIKYVRKN